LLTIVSVLVGPGVPQERSERTVAHSILQPNRESSAMTPLAVARSGDLNEHALWLVDPLGLSVAGGAISVESQSNLPEFRGLTVLHEWDEAGLIVVLARYDESGDWTYKTTLHISGSTAGQLTATGVVDYSYGGLCGLAPSGRLGDLSGSVTVEAAGWNEGAVVCLRFRLHGLRDDSPEWVQGQVTVR